MFYSVDAVTLAKRVNGMSIDEVVLVEQAKTNPEAFGILYERYANRIYNYIYFRVGNHYDAEDLTSRTFHRALDHIGNYKHRGAPFSAWLYRIAHNLMANWHRDRQRHPIVSIEDTVLKAKHDEEPPLITEQREEKEELLAAIRCLPSDRQELLMLKFVEGMSNAEVGRVMGRSEGAIKSLYFRTLVSLRQIVENGGHSNHDSG